MLISLCVYILKLFPLFQVLAEKGQRAVSQASSGERGSLVTIVGIVTASGNRLPPIYVFPRIRFNDRLMTGCFPGSLGLLSKSGWMISELFIDVLKHIQKNSNCTKERPILVLLDNHSSHCSLETINYSRENGIVILSFPPHTSHRLQPLDVSVFGPFKKFCRVSFNDFLCSNRGKQITIYDIAALTNQPFQRSFSSENILSGFKSTGIHPFNSQNFNEDEFAVENLPEQEAQSNRLVLEQNSNQPQSMIPEVMDVISQHIQVDQSRSHRPENITPEIIRPISRLHASNKTSRSGSSRIIISSVEKRRVEENQCRMDAKKASQSEKKRAVKRAIRFSSSKAHQQPKGAKHKTQMIRRKCSRDKKRCLQKKKGPRVVIARNQSISSDEGDSDIKIPYAESDQSVGSFGNEDDERCYESEENTISKYKLTDNDILDVGDYILAKLPGIFKKQIFYIGVIIEKYSDSTYNVSYLRRASTSSWIFIKPEITDNSVTLRNEIELKLPIPTNPASTSRCRTKYCFNIDFAELYIK